MKAFYSIFAILLGIFCIIYLLFYPQPSAEIAHNFSAKVLAKETVSNEHDTLSTALLLSPNQAYQKNLSAHNTFFGYFRFQKGITISITSKRIHNYKVTLLSDSNQKLSYNTQLSGNTCNLSFSDNTKNNSQRIFLSIFNQSTSPCSFQLKLQTDALTHRKEQTTQSTKNSKNTTLSSKKDTSNSKKQTNSKVDSINSTSTNTTKQQTTSNSKNSTSKKLKLSTIHNQKSILHPQFLLTNPNSVHKLSVKTQKTECSLLNFTFLSSNSSVAIIKNGKIYTKQEGIAILYIQDKRNPANTSSCFVKVIK